MASLLFFFLTYRTLRGQDQSKKCTLNFIKYTLGQTVLYYPQRVFYCFVGNKAQLPTCFSAD